jgi:two-component system, sensor histidine kinase PdtaS
MDSLLAFSRLAREWPGWARYGLTSLIVLLALGARFALDPYLAGFPYITFYLAIMGSALVFDRGSGFYAIALSSVLGLYFFVEPRHSILVHQSGAPIGLVMFVVTSGTMATLIEALHMSNYKLMRTLAERQVALEQARQSEQERATLFAEMDHRIRNNLQIVISMLGMQARQTKTDEGRATIESALDRISAMARIHNRLSRRDGAAVVDMRAFIRDLCDDLQFSLVGSRPIEFRCDAESHFLSLHQATTIGFLINELVTNSLKHAFTESGGTITVSFSRAPDGFYLLQVADDGPGLPQDEPARGLGHRLIQILARQLGGSIDVQGEGGASYVVRFSGQDTALKI